MKILVINCGSSSLKYQLIDMDNENVIAKGLVERIGIEGSRIKHETIGKEKQVIEKPLADHSNAIKSVIDALTNSEFGAVSSLDEIGAVGHRVVHGGEDFSESVVIDEKVMEAIERNIELAPLHNPPNIMEAIERNIELAPLHNPPNIMGIEACQKLLPSIKQVAVFDTAFHQSMPPVNYVYAIPYKYYEEDKIRRYGFHGTSHKYLTHRMAELLNKNVEEVNLITCHLGNGSSISAIKKGKSVNTSMGLTPLEGLPMGTRSGDIDPAIVTFIMDKENLNTEEISNILNKESGVLGISGVSSDFRDIEEAAEAGNERAQLALDVFEDKVRKFISSYITEFEDINKIDAIVFTAGLGENSPETREHIINKMSVFGLKIDKAKNNVRGKEQLISSDDSSIKVFVVPTDEEMMIARDTLSLV
ncbi:acetate kinase [Anaerosphaera multitolerans]|uniref:Acetate kinase n=1 Tax=Anaerosphaera multitolerans TaxID=2487351 RepID=A0A437S779_9FIRM|nr:acetate kinase [Anaerosphaera multitolerans]RVU54893.1 acetate kinase [Anaerosphaera multitolerans]